MTVRELHQLLGALPDDVQDRLVLISIGSTVADAHPMTWRPNGEGPDIVYLQHLDVLDDLQAACS